MRTASGSTTSPTPTPRTSTRCTPGTTWSPPAPAPTRGAATSPGARPHGLSGGTLQHGGRSDTLSLRPLSPPGRFDEADPLVRRRVRVRARRSPRAGAAGAGVDQPRPRPPAHLGGRDEPLAAPAA